MTLNSDYLLNKEPEFSTLVELLNYRAKNQPDKTAYIFLHNGETETSRLTYQELDREARAIAAYLHNLGAKGQRALLLYSPGLEFITAFFGCLYASVVAVPAYPPRRNHKLSRLQAIASNADIKVVLTTASLLSNIETLFASEQDLTNLHCIATDNIDTELGLNWAPPVISRETLTFLQYTSGSTGMPKGVMISHSNMLHNSAYIQQSVKLTPDSVSVTWLPSFHDMGLIDGIIQPLYTGFLGVLMAPVSFLQQPIRWLEAISHYKATHGGSPNFAYELCTRKLTPDQMENLDLSSWSNAYTGAEPIRRETIEQFAAKFARCGFHAKFFYPCYGLAENTLMVAGGVLEEEPIYCTVQADALAQNVVEEVSEDNERVRHLVGCGSSKLGIKIVIANPETQTQCQQNQVGEIWVSGLSVAQGYWKQPEQTEETFNAYLADTKEGPFMRTGDLGFLRSGELFVTGRIKDVIIIRGQNHYPQDIELTVEKSHPALAPGCGAAFAVDINNQERLVIVQEVKRSEVKKLNASEIFGNIRQAVSKEHNLNIYAVVLIKPVSIHKTSSGKIQRHACRSGFLNECLDVVHYWCENPQDRTKFLNLQVDAEPMSVA
ncbi:amino acid adenylation domain-containing protein [Calothrix sp. NIES-4071]|nr:amino acid adenylation domain-containing protein [Calothrix sp. NIES-4071]BAZ54952.1 amino acid adenylation domain-containing protein [Calothrix sp. NIES-4105]